jgi:hypothetical protein
MDSQLDICNLGVVRRMKEMRSVWRWWRNVRQYAGMYNSCQYKFWVATTILNAEEDQIKEHLVKNMTWLNYRKTY